jgi:tetrapyrrole methylase family protein/MazG family protein
MRSFSGLRRTVSTLRGPDGCPWDRAQSHRSLRPFLREEASEALEAMGQDDVDGLKEELGDLLLQVLLHVQIAEDLGEFRLEDVIYSISDKLVRRHPHVFADATADTPDAVMDQWEGLKRDERGDQSALTGIPQTLPALALAHAVQHRAEKAGFAFDSVEQTWDAFQEEVDELKAAETPEQQCDEAGDTLFALVNLSRRLGVDGEDALRSTVRGFSDLFRRLEDLASERGADLKTISTDEKLAMWEEAKNAAKS